MNGHTVKLDDPAHEAAQALLPWYAADRLDAADSAAVRRHLADCAVCRAELAYERRVQAAAALPAGGDGPASAAGMAQGEPGAAGGWGITNAGAAEGGGVAGAGPTKGGGAANARAAERAGAAGARAAECTGVAGADAAEGMGMAGAGAATGLDVERALAALMPRLDADVPAPAPVRPWWRRAAANDASWMRWALAAQFVVIAGLALLLARPVADGGAYHVLGAGAASGNLVVVFKPETAERDLRRILQANGAHVVDGPTVTDAYLLSVPDPRAARARLRAEPAVVLAETLDAGAQP